MLKLRSFYDFKCPCLAAPPQGNTDIWPTLGHAYISFTIGEWPSTTACFDIYVPLQIAERCLVMQTYQAPCTELDISANISSARKDLHNQNKNVSKHLCLDCCSHFFRCLNAWRHFFMVYFRFIPNVCEYFRAQIGSIVVHTAVYSVPRTCSCAM